MFMCGQRWMRTQWLVETEINLTNVTWSLSTFEADSKCQSALCVEWLLLHTPCHPEGSGCGYVCVRWRVTPSSFLPGKILLSLLAVPVMPPSLALNLHNTAVGDKARRPSGHFTFSEEEGRQRHEHSHPPVNYSLITYLFLPLVSVRMVEMCICSSLINLCMQRCHINTHI